MLPLIAGSFFAVAVVCVVGGLVELRTAIRLLSARMGTGDRGLTNMEAKVAATDGVLASPLANRSCVMFTLVLLRRRLHETVGAGALFFNEVRPFSIVTPDGRSIPVDQKKHPVFILGLDVVEKPLPFLPNTIAGLLVQRFGRKGYIWAEEHVVRAQESALDDGATVHVLCEDGAVKMLSTTPLRTLGRGALMRGGLALAAGLLNFLFFWLIH
ncbi:MAG: hypothetical protein Q8O67_13530 [Deltaproteobacteria bacterium]|nr:hypothetical protein [Deltaproteobacteria bacterium]